MHTRKFDLSFYFYFLQAQPMCSLNDSSPHPSAIENYGRVYVNSVLKTLTWVPLLSFRHTIYMF